MKSETNGLVDFHDNRESNIGFFCIQLVKYLNEEAEIGSEEYQNLWEDRFEKARNKECFYKSKCPIYAKTIKKEVK